MDALYVNGDIVGHVVPGSGCVLLGMWLGARVVYVQQRPSAEDSIWLRRFELLTGVLVRGSLIALPTESIVVVVSLYCVCRAPPPRVCRLAWRVKKKTTVCKVAF